MTDRNSTLTAARLRELLDYDPATGAFTWRKNLKGGMRNGDVAGCIGDRGDGGTYRRIRVDGVLYYSHRLVWLYVYGEWPTRQIDHKDGNSDRLANLRHSNQAQNVANARVRSDSASGFK